MNPLEPHSPPLSYLVILHRSLGASGNRAAARDLAAWALSRRGVLRLVDMSHSIVGGEVAPERYRIKDEVEVYARIEELVDGQWVGYECVVEEGVGAADTWRELAGCVSQRMSQARKSAHHVSLPPFPSAPRM